MHTWLNTQNEGWWRLALDKLQIPYDYISTQDVSAATRTLTPKYDVIVFAPVGRDPQSIVAGMPMYGNPIPWKTTTPDAEHRQDRLDRRHASRASDSRASPTFRSFMRRGGVLITAMDTADFAITFGLAQGVSLKPPQRMKLAGTVLRSKRVDASSPIAYGIQRLALDLLKTMATSST